MVIFTLQNLPDLNANTTWIIISALINSKVNSLEKTQRISLFHAIHQGRSLDKVDKVAECIHLIYCVLKKDSESQYSYPANLDGPDWP